MIQSPNFVHLSNVAVWKSTFTVKALKLFLVVFLIRANWNKKNEYMFWYCSNRLFRMLAEYMTLYLSQFELLVQKGRFSSLLFCLLSYRAGLIMLIRLNSVKNPMFGLRLYSQNIPFCSSLPLYLCTESLWLKMWLNSKNSIWKSWNRRILLLDIVLDELPYLIFFPIVRFRIET